VEVEEECKKIPDADKRFYELERLGGIAKLLFFNF
jgi:hypothetical protein